MYPSYQAGKLHVQSYFKLDLSFENESSETLKGNKFFVKKFCF